MSKLKDILADIAAFCLVGSACYLMLMFCIVVTVEAINVISR